MTPLREAAQQALEALELAQTDVHWELNSPTRKFLRKAEKSLRAALAEPVQEEEGLIEFLADLQRSRIKYPNNRRMFDGLMGEVDELRRAYAGDGDIRAEAFDVAVCAFRIATEGDSGGNTMLEQAEPVQEPCNPSCAPGYCYCASLQRKPLTEEDMLDEFCKTPGIHQFVSAFFAGVRYAERAHGIGG